MRVLTCAIVVILAVCLMAPMLGCGAKKTVELEVTRETVVTKPIIQSVTLEPGRLDTRERASSVRVTMRGDPGLQATFDVVGGSLGRPMEEVQPGVYVGNIDVDKGYQGEIRVVGHVMHLPSGASQQRSSDAGVSCYISTVEIVQPDVCTPEMAREFDAALRPLTLYYRTNVAVLTEKNRELLDANKGVLASNEKCKIWVLGHTDDVGDGKYNYVLSSFRSIEVVDYLKTLGIPDDRIVREYFGETRPAVAGETEEARAKNRRVEIRGVYPY